MAEVSGVWLFVLGLVAILAGVALPAIAARRGQRLGDPATVWNRPAKLFLYWSGSLNLLILAALVAGAGWLAGASPAAWGWRRPAAGSGAWAWGLAGLAFLLWLVDAGRRFHSPSRRADALVKLRRRTPFTPANAAEFGHYAVLALAAGVCEEWVYRGFLISWLRNLGAGEWLAVLLSAAVFGLAHLYQDRSGAAKVAALAVLFGFLFTRTGSILPGAAVHTLIDLLAGAAGWWLQRDAALRAA